ncbi:MAG TPA: septal ring lytic transglycosylase RlpA family protein [Acidobacteriota bacterium]|nr:septal ring lytic transglycosylase RlpA family protein [Acidobacteriota bacterium]
MAVAVASYYGAYHHGRLTASGERFDRWGMTCAHKTLPLGSWVAFKNPANGRTALCRVNDRGPYRPGREFDLSEGAYRKLARGMEEKGVIKIEWRRVR